MLGHPRVPMTPETFERELYARMGAGYRLRWSRQYDVWCIEQKVASGVYETPGDGSDDSTIRMRDGYALVCQINPRPFITCKECFQQIDIPHLTVKEVKCPYCEVIRGDTAVRYVAGYYPLCDALLERVERTAPKRGKQWVTEMHSKNAARVAAQEKEWDNWTTDLWRDHYNRIADRPQVGAGGSIKSTGTWTTL